MVILTACKPELWLSRYTVRILYSLTLVYIHFLVHIKRLSSTMISVHCLISISYRTWSPHRYQKNFIAKLLQFVLGLVTYCLDYTATVECSGTVLLQVKLLWVVAQNGNTKYILKCFTFPISPVKFLWNFEELHMFFFFFSMTVLSSSSSQESFPKPVTFLNTGTINPPAVLTASSSSMPSEKWFSPLPWCLSLYIQIGNLEKSHSQGLLAQDNRFPFTSFKGVKPLRDSTLPQISYMCSSFQRHPFHLAPWSGNGKPPRFAVIKKLLRRHQRSVKSRRMGHQSISQLYRRPFTFQAISVIEQSFCCKGINSTWNLNLGSKHHVPLIHMRALNKVSFMFPLYLTINHPRRKSQFGQNLKDSLRPEDSLWN